MASNLGASSRAIARVSRFPHYHYERSFAFTALPRRPGNRTSRQGLMIRALDRGDSYLHMWRKAVDREKEEIEFQKLVDNLADVGADGDNKEGKGGEELEKKSQEFEKILEVSKEDRDRIQRMQVIDRAAAAISAARAILGESKAPNKDEDLSDLNSENGLATGGRQGGTWYRDVFVPQSEASPTGVPGPDFWSWTPPQQGDRDSDDDSTLQPAKKSSVYPTLASHIMEKERSADSLPIPFESKLYDINRSATLPPFQSLIEVERKEVSEPNLETPSLNKEHDLNVLFAEHAAEAAHALEKLDESSYGVNTDGSRWWKQTGVEKRHDGVVCRWTMTRCVSADQAVEWQEKYWEASDEFDYKELGSEKSGRDAAGNVWREFWRESVSQECGLVHLQKTADKWGKNGKGEEWQEKWWEHYDAAGQSEKWAHKWCSIDPNTQLEAGHAHVWHERWGEKYDGRGGSTKYTDKWAERCEGDGWTKWGDKWDECFDPNSKGVKQGETWWEGKHGERWNRTWGEQHNGSGWVHKYGKSSSGEHWDTHVQQDTCLQLLTSIRFLSNTMLIRTKLCS
ncbi:uncharacterized protein LOC110815815 isoform X2 [Carica papaya]|uniref:uncharacterized protein LOC110815815 isoform X2 n=1 Tax=Carica papaya TaxID=3649 RepID=UPI000B8CDA96|nr:uncharacterized protein LOC110815815 isoform X2 [Carica papaya]